MAIIPAELFLNVAKIYYRMEKSKKILIFSTAYYPLVGGAEVAIKEITDRIEGVQFDLITAKFDSNLLKFERVGNVNVHRLGFGFKTLDKLLLPFWGAIFALNLNNKNHYDYFWCVMASFASGAAYIANMLKFWRPVPIILNLQEGDSEDHFKKRWFGLINLSWRVALSRTQKLTVLSSFLAQRAKKFGYNGEINIIPNGVDIQKFEVRDTSYEKEEIEKIRRDLGIKEGEIALVTVSRLNIKNGVADVIKALVKLSENIKFLILGDGELRKDLEGLTKSLKVSDRVIFKGFVSHDDMPKYLHACDIFIRASLSEGFGNSFIEAMACKLPVIATPVGGIPDFLKDHETGYFCEVKNSGSIADTVQKVIVDPDKNKIIENAYNMVLEKYSWDLIANQMKEVFGRAPKDVSSAPKARFC
ncbi:MAG: glycosyltransferase [Candidatus Paceibacterota bacterium]